MAVPYSTFTQQGLPEKPNAGLSYEHPSNVTWLPGKRRRLNGVAIIANMFVPTAVFATLFYVLGFHVRYQQPHLAWGLLLVGLIATAISFAVARLSKKQQPMWYTFFAIMLGIAVFCSAICGDYVFKRFMEASLDFKNLNSYPAVNPARQRGQQLMDAGRVYFSSGTKIDQKMSMGFQDYSEYCVAPIVNGAGQLASYDFWAVGVDCCNNPDHEFRCGEYNNPHAASGLRQLDEDKRKFFRLAVEQAEAAYGIKASHPLFFTWTQDPLAIVASQVDAAWKNFFMGIFCFFLLNLLGVGTAVLGFSRIGYF
eukprot:TRINITY_DN3076_c0_g1_i1.p1 TRINITY_DN3076_c0_g1~~TRINITY_DN3076_c0_g1_i1.p1  ORF type:complete len:310 (-),score=64.94 TRINITY_DN3076_c0_g1_i1:116-1045(-)